MVLETLGLPTARKPNVITRVTCARLRPVLRSRRASGRARSARPVCSASGGTRPLAWARQGLRLARPVPCSSSPLAQDRRAGAGGGHGRAELPGGAGCAGAGAAPGARGRGGRAGRGAAQPPAGGRPRSRSARRSSRRAADRPPASRARASRWAHSSGGRVRRTSPRSPTCGLPSPGRGARERPCSTQCVQAGGPPHRPSSCRRADARARRCWVAHRRRWAGVRVGSSSGSRGPGRGRRVTTSPSTSTPGRPSAAWRRSRRSAAGSGSRRTRPGRCGCTPPTSTPRGSRCGRRRRWPARAGHGPRGWGAGAARSRSRRASQRPGHQLALHGGGGALQGAQAGVAHASASASGCRRHHWIRETIAASGTS